MGAHGRSGKVYTINGDYKQISFLFNPVSSKTNLSYHLDVPVNWQDAWSF